MSGKKLRFFFFEGYKLKFFINERKEKDKR